MVPGLDYADFLAMFPEFTNVPEALVTTFINLINNGYGFTQQNVTDPVILGIYYWLLAHFVASSTLPVTGSTSGPAGSYLPSATAAGLVSASFQTVANLSADQSFMLSTRYGQVFWTMSKQQYVQNYYFNQTSFSSVSCGWG